MKKSPLSGSRTRLITLLACVSVVVGCGDGFAPGMSTITEADLRADLFALAGDSLGGRLVGTPELEEASAWIGQRFADLGLEPAGDGGSYDQYFDLHWSDLAGGDELSVSGGPARRPGNGWTPSSAGAGASASGSLVFAGFGIVEERLGWDDYQGQDVEGRIVVMLEREPGVADPASPFDGVVTAEASRAWRKVLAAQERGAVGVLFVRDVHNRSAVGNWPLLHASQWPASRRRIERFTLAAWTERITIPAAQISAEIAEALVSGSGRSLDELAEAAETAPSGLGVIDLPEETVAFTTSVQRNTTRGHNVLAMIEGSDPDLRDEVVIIGAHHDHNGSGPFQGDDEVHVYNGADDDASGTVGVMAIAAAYANAAERGDRPRRSVLFALWDAEERGLLGAWYYTVRPLFPLPATVAKLNLDMIGRNEEVPQNAGGRFRGLEPQTSESNANAINILGSTRSPTLAAVVDSANGALGGDADREPLTLRFRYDNNESNLLRRSDHWPFLENGVPAVWFHTGLHPDYHTPDDDPERIEFEKMTRIVRLVHQTSWDVANAESRPTLEGMRSRERN